MSVKSVDIGQIYIANMDFVCKLNIIINQLSSLSKMANVVSSTDKLVNSVSSDFVD
jgi:hypothetical protein